MKKWLIVLTIICGVSAITGAVAGGNAIFNTTEETYEDRGEQALSKTALSNIYIHSAIPIEVYPTTGEPKVEFVQKSSNFIKSFPKYELNVVEKEGSTYINLNEVEPMLWFGHTKDESYLTVYLPEGSIERLDIRSRNNGSYRYNHTINLKNIHVKDLNMDLYQKASIDLDGNYQKVSLDAGFWEQNTFNMRSNTPATVQINGSIESNLTGQFEKVTLENCDEDIMIQSQVPAKVNIKNSEGIDIDLKGQYSQVSIDGYNQMINLDSNVECRLNIYGGENTLYAKGPFKMVELNGYDSALEVQSTVVPKSIRMGDKMNSKVKLILPSNIPGFTINSHLTAENEFESEIVENSIVMLLNEAIKSDFNVAMKAVNGQTMIQYGNGSTKIEIPEGFNEEFRLDLIDGGYDVALS